MAGIGESEVRNVRHTLYADAREIAFKFAKGRERARQFPKEAQVHVCRRTRRGHRLIRIVGIVAESELARAATSCGARSIIRPASVGVFVAEDNDGSSQRCA